MTWRNPHIQKHKSVEERFWEKVDICCDDECWEWLASKGRRGYGTFGFNDSTVQANRVAWILTNGEIPENLLVCHTCDNPACCNPSHLFLGNQRDNIQDMIIKGRRKSDKGEDNPQAKLTTNDVRQIRNLWRTHEYYQREIAELFGISQAQVSDIVNNRYWNHI